MSNNIMQEFSISRVVPLMLSVTDIQPYDSGNVIYPPSVIVSNSVGSITNCVSDVTWNIDLQRLLGDLYDKYEYFNLELVQFLTIPFTAGNGLFNSKPFGNDINSNNNLGYINLNVNVSGLQFYNSTYNQKTGNHKKNAHICNVSNQTRTTDYFSQNYGLFRGDEYIYHSQKNYANYNVCFKKEKNVQLNIKLSAIDSDLDYAPSSVFTESDFAMSHFSVKFNIVPFK